MYFDDKHEHFYVFVDYLFQKGDLDRVLSPNQINSVLRDGEGLHADGEVDADSDEGGRCFRFDPGHSFRRDAGHGRSEATLAPLSCLK